MATKLLTISMAALLAACATQTPVVAPVAPPRPDDAALASVTAEDLLQHVRVLSSDAFEGRLPGTPGEDKTVAYLTEQFRKLGLAPGNPDGRYVQDVPLVGIDGKAQMRLSVNGKPIATAPRRMVAACRAVMVA